MSAKRVPPDVLEHPVRHERAQVRIAGPEIEVEEAVVVEVGEVAAHRGEDQVEAGLLRLVLESCPFDVVPEAVGEAFVPLADHPLDDVFDRVVETGREDVLEAVVIVVPRPAREADLRTVDPHRLGDVAERAVPVVVVEPARSRSGGPRTDPGNRRCRSRSSWHPCSSAAGRCRRRPGGDVLECAVAPVVVKAVALKLRQNEDIEQAVVVVIGPARRGRIDGLVKPGGLWSRR